MGGDRYHSTCPGRDVFDHLTSRWAVLVLDALQHGERRFFELRQRVDGISEKMLAHTLRTLTRDGLVDRVVTPTTPPRVSYALTPTGIALAGQLLGLLDGIRVHSGEIADARRRYDDAVTAP